MFYYFNFQVLNSTEGKVILTTSLNNFRNNLISLFKDWRRLFTLIIPPLFVMALMLTVFALNDMYPFGGRTLALCDMHQQVVPLMLDFKDILAGKGDFFFNMQNASGMNFYGVFLFFISSPLTFLVMFVDKVDMLVFMNILTMLKMMLCAVTANAYFRHCHKKLNLFYGMLFSVMYAFSGFAMLFYQNTVWLDVMYFFPLLLISFEALIKRGKTRGLVFCLVGMLVLNYYLSYMVVLFTILFFGLYLFINRRRNTKGIAPRFAVACIIAALLSAVVWLPSFAQYLSSARGSNIIKGLFDASIFTGIYTNLPLIFCTGFGVAALVMFFARRKSRSSRLYAALFILMLLPVIFEPINKMWHTGDYMAFPMRYGYITTFMLLIYAATKLKHLTPDDFCKKSSPCLAIPGFIAIIGFGVFSIWYYYNYAEELDSYPTTLWGSFNSFLLLLIIACGFAVLFLYVLSIGVMKKLSYRLLVVALACITAFECFFNANVYIASADYNPTQYTNAVALEDKIPADSDFYRVKLKQSQRKYFDANLIGGLGYSTIAHYTSLTSENYMFAMKRLGYSSYWMEVTGNGGTLLTDAVMSIKYYIEQFTAREPVIYRDKNYSIFESEYYLPLGIITDSDMSLQEELPAGERIELQEYISRVLFGSDSDLFTKYEPTGERNITYTYSDGIYSFAPANKNRTATLSYKIYIDGKQTLYFDCFDLVTRNVREHIYNSFAIYVNGIKVNLTYPNADTNGLLELGTYENEAISIDVDLSKSTYCSSFGLYGLSHEKLSEVIEGAKTAGLTVDGREISGTVTDAAAGQYLYISVPYDKGFKAYINGEETEIYRAFTGFMAIALSEGENNIRLYFTPVGFNMGLLISGIGVVLCALWIIFRKRLDLLILKADKLCRLGVYVLLCGVLLVIYILPMIISAIGMIYNSINS